ncbi:MAG: formylglycine-generating enzyme family protein, partial [Cyanobacteria bacterium J06576_12]
KAAAPAMEPAMFNRQQGYDIVIAKAVVDAEQSYRKQVQKKVRRGRLSAAARVELQAHWQPLLQITPEQAKAIEEEVLKPYKEKARHLALYAEALAEEKEIAYPFDDELITEFKSLQRTFGLSDQNVQAEEIRVLGERMQAQVRLAPEIENQTIPKTTQRNFTLRFETVSVDHFGKVFETVTDEAEYFTENLADGLTLDMVRVPGGKFLMGAVEEEVGASSDEYPQHEVNVPEFWLGRFTVTQAQWRSIANLMKIEIALESDPSKFKGENWPVEQVSWEDAMEFCRRLSQLSEKEYSLPSEAQWEYACRAGTMTPFYFGQTMTTDLANYAGTSSSRGSYSKGPKGIYRSKTTEVGIFPPNSFGLHDMHGNVWEWCFDGWHDTYIGAPTDGRVWEPSGKGKVLRGGSWTFNPSTCRSAERNKDKLDRRYSNIGFRVMTIATRT